MSTTIIHPHITSRNDIGDGKPIISGTRTRVSNLIAYYKLGYLSEELAREFPHLSLSRIHDALSYYYENQKDIDKEIDDDSEENVKILLQQ